jgi:hypothetical protein
MKDILNPQMQYGWMCPNCLTAHSPAVMTCPISQTVRLTGTTTVTPPSIPTTVGSASPSCTHVWVDAVVGEYCQYCLRVRRSISQEGRMKPTALAQDNPTTETTT